MRIFVGIAIIATSSPLPAFAAEPTSDKVICKRTEEGNTGSNLVRTKKICRKASEWKRLQDQTDRSLSEIRDKGVVPEQLVAPGPGGGQ